MQAGDVFGQDAAPRQVFVDQRIAEFVGQRIGKQARQAVKGFLGQRGKAEATLGFHFHQDGREFETAFFKFRRVAEFVVTGLVPERRHRPDELPPEIDLNCPNFVHCLTPV